MIKKANKNVGFLCKGIQNIDKVYKGIQPIFEQGFVREQTGVPPITTTYQTIGKDLIDYKIYGNSIQDGTPTPTTPIEIESVGEKTKNLININNYATIGNYVGIDISDLIIGETYTFSSKNNITRIKISNSTTGYNSVATQDLSGFKSFTFVMAKDEHIPSSAKQYLFLSKNAAGTFITSISEIDGYEIQIEKNNNNTIYEPYGYKIPVIVKDNNNVIQSTTNIYLDEPLRKAGDLADYIDFRNQKAVRYITLKSLRVKDVPSTKLSGYSIGRDSIYFTDGSSTSFVPLCEYLQGRQGSGYTIANNITHYNVTNQMMCCIPQSILGTTDDSTSSEIVTAINNWASNNNIFVYYPLQTPTEETITLPNIPTIKGTTVFEIDTNIQPSSMYIKYKGK